MHARSVCTTQPIAYQLTPFTHLCSPRFEIPMSDEVLPPNQQPERGIANLKCNKYVRDGAT